MRTSVSSIDLASLLLAGHKLLIDFVSYDSTPESILSVKLDHRVSRNTSVVIKYQKSC